jgi:hypothetical protein
VKLRREGRDSRPAHYRSHGTKVAFGNGTTPRQSRYLGFQPLAPNANNQYRTSKKYESLNGRHDVGRKGDLRGAKSGAKDHAS